ncbi:hypothetical protein SDC9_141089 [bioreactor metagenome]|uniref:Uncharacterized protein n=1 Tax=bioreactor metagenome TaxID=1076179 RepID=A0A645DX45_9ZZZZ
MAAVAVVIRLFVFDQRPDILKTVEPGQAAVDIDRRQLADAPLKHDPIGVLKRSSFRRGHQIGPHHIADFDIVTGKKFDIARSKDAEQFALVVDDRESGKRIIFGPLLPEHLGHRDIGGEHHRMLDHAVQIEFDLAHFFHLALDRQIFVDDAQTAEPGHRDRHRAFGHGVHGRRNQRHIELDIAGKTAFDAGFMRQKIGVTRNQGNVVKSESFKLEGRHEIIEELVHCLLRREMKCKNLYSVI